MAEEESEGAPPAQPGMNGSWQYGLSSSLLGYFPPEVAVQSMLGISIPLHGDGPKAPLPPPIDTGHELWPSQTEARYADASLGLQSNFDG